MTRTFRDTARYWRSPLLPGGELLTAEFHDHRFVPHWHDWFVIAVIEAGAQGYQYRGTHHVAVPGSLGLINAGEVHTGERAVDEGWAYRVFYPSVEWLGRLSSDLAGRPTDVPWLPDEAVADREVAHQLARAHRALETGTDLLAAETILVRAFGLLLSRHSCARPQPAPLRPDQARVETMKTRLAAELAEPLTLTALASVAGLSPFHAARLFSRTVGMPPHAWRNQLRLNRALQLLRQGSSVTEAALWCGYADQSHFTRHFRRAYGVPPGRWQTA